MESQYLTTTYGSFYIKSTILLYPYLSIMTIYLRGTAKKQNQHNANLLLEKTYTKKLTANRTDFTKQLLFIIEKGF